MAPTARVDDQVQKPPATITKLIPPPPHALYRTALPPIPACVMLKACLRHDERVMAEPCLRREVRGSHRPQRKFRPLTLALSP